MTPQDQADQTGSPAPTDLTDPDRDPQHDTLVEDDLVDEVSIDGMCGVY